MATHSLDRSSSNTSTLCSTRLFAVKSSLPTVTLTGLRWNVLASRRTASGHVALTVDLYININEIKSNLWGQPTHHRLAFCRRFCTRNDVTNIILKSFIQHAIGFVQDEVVDPARKIRQLSGIGATPKETHSLRSQAPSCIRSNIRPGVPTIIRVVNPSLILLAFLSILTCGSLGTPPKTATLAMPNGFPSAESVSWV